MQQAAPPRHHGNRLLAAMPPMDLRMLHRLLEPVDLQPGDILLREGSPVGHVHFPEAGMVASLRASSPGSGPVEVGIVGSEGLVGLSALVNPAIASFSAVVLVGGPTLRLRADLLRARADQSAALHHLLQRYTAARLAAAAERAACATAHQLRGRVAAWLLAVHDRAGPGFPVTQETMALALGARRPTVTAVLQELRAENLVRLARGRITLCDARGLAMVACTCGLAARERSRRLLQVGSSAPVRHVTVFEDRRTAGLSADSAASGRVRQQVVHDTEIDNSGANAPAPADG